MRRDIVAPIGVVALLGVALLDTLTVAPLRDHPGRIVLAVCMVGIVAEWFRLRKRDPSGTADRLGLMIGVLMAAFAYALD